LGAKSLDQKLGGLLSETDAKATAVIAGFDETGLDGTAVALISPPGVSYTSRHEAIVKSLLAPLQSAYRQHRRIRELAELRARAEAENQSLLARLGRNSLSDVIVGAQSGLKPAMDRVDQVARSDLPVLLLGETGSGKEVLARAIHDRSPRNEKPFIRVNCGAIPPELADSELFGHERGSFTGAVEQRRGWFEQADGGSLLFDEIGELPLPVQVRLLRVLQDGHVTRVGGEKAMSLDVRIIAATNQDLHSMVDDGRFREDLWYRLAVFPIRIPPLRERAADIPALATHFAKRAARRFGVPSLAPTDDDVRVLQAYGWPGNARELQSVMDRAVILGNGRRLDIAASLGTEPRARPSAPAVGVVPVAGANSTNLQQIDSLDDAMRRHIKATLEACRGRVDGEAGAARLLKINPHTLRGRMRKLGIDWTSFRGSKGNR
jgi:transcriptional regulator with GAF, ATPase, and Fis domain